MTTRAERIKQTEQAIHNLAMAIETVTLDLDPRYTLEEALTPHLTALRKERAALAKLQGLPR